MANIRMILGWMGLIAALSTVEGYVPQAHAMPPASPSLAALLLARTCVREAGWEVTDDCAAIHVVAQKRADLANAHYESMIQRYSKPSLNRPWIEQLEYDGSMPADWPMHPVAWRKLHKAKWLALLAHAKAIVRGEVVAVCAADVDHWGDALGDRERAIGNGWTQIECGETKNQFWSVAPTLAANGH